MNTVANIMNKLPENFIAAAADDLDAQFQILINDAEPYLISISNGTCNIQQTESDTADVTLIMSSETFCDVMTGELSGSTAFMSGKIRAEGNVMLATKLSKLFKK